MKGKYKVDLKKEVFAKFFSVLKINPGSAVLKLDHKKNLEMEYTIEKCPNIRVIVETPSRSIWLIYVLIVNMYTILNH